MALIDSEASLKQRCLPVEGDDSLFESLKANGVKTLRQLAFALGSPQTPPSDDSLKDLAAKVYKCAEGTQPTIGQIANVRMLIFEASTLVVAQLRAQATADDSDLAGRKLPHVEKQARLTSQKARLPGLLIEGELQPSYALVDACALMSESNSITWISPSRCTKRDAEVQQLGKEKTSLVQIEAGTLKVSSSSKLPDADTTTALQLLYCFQRRGLALDQCSLIGWSDHEWYVQSLMSYLHGEPVSGARPAIAQVIRADREAWTLMSREIEGPIGVKDAAGELVMAAALRRLAKDPRVVVHLVTAPQPQKVAPPPSIPTDSAAAAALAEKDTKKKKRKRLTGLVPESLKGCVTKIKVHRDSNNDDSHCNILLKLSEFQGGAVWVEGDGDIEVTDPKGRVLKGHELSWENNKITLDARNLYHATLPWTGRRLVLVGYHVRDFQRLPCDDRQRLIDIGFQCLPLDLGNDLESFQKLVEAEKNCTDVTCVVMVTAALGLTKWLALNALPRGRRNPALVQEFVSFKFVAVPADPPSADESLLAGLPKGARVLSRLTFDGGYEEACKTLSISSGEISIADGKSELLEGELIRIGLPSEPKAFVQRAVQAGHPRDGSAHVSKLVVNAIKANFSDPPAQTVTSRAAALKHWTARAKQLEQKEEELHRSLPEHLRCLLEGKRLLLWQEMHEAAGSPDDQLITHMCDGFKLSGWLSQGLNQSTIAKMRVRQDEDLEKATWQETEKELQKGWIFADTKSCIELCALARRFGIRQLDKVRVIDDASICGINATVGLKYGFQMHSIDRYAAWISKALRINEGRLPACKGEAEPMIMGANSLPFGAVGSVAAFLRISLSIWLIGVRLFSIFWTAFFDDYGVTTRDELVANTDSCICAIFDLLGVEFAREGKKAPPFSRDFKLLGVRVDLNDAPRGIVRIGNTAERREELNVFIEDILQANCLDLKTAERLRGRLVFFEGFVFGRMSNSAIRTVDRAARAGLTSKRLPEDVRKSLVVIRERLRVAEPVTIATKNHHSWLIFTDGACEGEKKLGSIGGVIVGLSGHPISFFSEQVPLDIMKILLSNSQNPIFELELLPVLVAYRLWGQWCRFSQAVFYLDNEGARHSIIAAGGGADLARVIIDGILSKETSLQIHAWYARVPTHSNIADSPSRGEYEGLLNIGCSRLRVDWDAVARQCFPLGFHGASEIKLSEHERHKALANGWHAGAARLIFIMAMFAATPAKADKELNPLGGTALDIAAGLWQGRPPLLGPGPGDYDSFDLSYLQDPAEHWKLSRHIPHPDHSDALMEPGLQQWIRIWFQMRAHLAELRLAVVEQVEEMVVDMEDETRSWYQSLRPHVQKAYRSTTGVCTLQLPALRRICELFGWQDLGIFDELTHGFRLLGPLAPGLGWKRRNDDRYANPLDIAEFMVKNKQYVVDKLRRCRVDPCWKQMADEIAADVSLGRMEGPFTSPSDWPKSAVPLASHEHTSKLLEGPGEHQPTCFAFAVHQVGSDGRPKVRRAEDWRRSFANATVAAEDSPPYHDVNSYVQLVRAIKEIDPQAEILIWGLDHESAYRQLPALDPSHTYVVLATPEGVTLWRHTVLMFGSVASVWSYCRIADLMGWLCRACIFTPALHFVDDFGSAEVTTLANSSFVIQGVDIFVSHESVTVQGTEERRQRLDEALADVLTQVARTLQLFGPCFAELDSQALVVIIAIGDSMDRFATGSDYYVFPFDKEAHSVLYADAFFNLFDKDWKPSDEDIPNWGRTPPETLRNGWGFVVTVQGQTHFAHGRVPYWFVRAFTSRRAYIYMLEIVAQILPLFAMEDQLDRHVMLFVDNEPARHALTRGFGKDESINCLLQHAWRFLEAQSFRPAWQRVTSSANVSDSVSRGDLRHARAEGWIALERDWDSLFEELLTGSERFRATGVL
ncbi:kanC [Symbiodinium sp. CCMP2592]|nr:kanC [Symbiodinium sp. CCMP2592]